MEVSKKLTLTEGWVRKTLACSSSVLWMVMLSMSVMSLGASSESGAASAEPSTCSILLVPSAGSMLIAGGGRGRPEEGEERRSLYQLQN